MKLPKAGWLLPVVALLAAGIGYLAWQRLRAGDLPEGLASGNGRIEAVEIDVAARVSGRIKEMLANEGDFVPARSWRGWTPRRWRPNAPRRRRSMSGR